MQQLRNDYSLTFPPLSIARYSFIQLSRLRRREVKENDQTSKRYQRGFDSNPGSLDCESGILPLSHRAPLNYIDTLCTVFPTSISTSDIKYLKPYFAHSNKSHVYKYFYFHTGNTPVCKVPINMDPNLGQRARF